MAKTDMAAATPEPGKKRAYVKQLDIPAVSAGRRHSESRPSSGSSSASCRRLLRQSPSRSISFRRGHSSKCCRTAAVAFGIT